MSELALQTVPNQPLIGAEHKFIGKLIAGATAVALVAGGVWVSHNHNASTLPSSSGPAHSALPSPSTSTTEAPAPVLAACDAWQQHSEAQPELATSITQIAETTIVDAHIAPGATVAVGCGDETLASIAVGNDGENHPVSPSETEEDLASMSKMFTATAVMMLAEEGKLSLDETIGTFIPQYKIGPKAQVTFRMLMEHRSGIVDPSYYDLTKGTQTIAQVWGRIWDYPLKNAPGTKYDYSNVGFNVLFSAATNAAGQPLENFIHDKILTPLGMTHTLYYSTKPGAPKATNCAPTTQDAGSADKGLPVNRLCQPQDDLGYRLGGVGGHDGWFSTADDMGGKFSAMLADGGTFNGQKILAPASVAALIKSQPDVDYGMGMRTNSTQFFSTAMSPEAAGHTGWNGDGTFFDPTTKLWMVELMNGTFKAPAPVEKSYVAIRGLNDALVDATNKLTSVTK